MQPPAATTSPKGLVGILKSSRGRPSGPLIGLTTEQASTEEAVLRELSDQRYLDAVVGYQAECRQAVREAEVEYWQGEPIPASMGIVSRRVHLKRMHSTLGRGHDVIQTGRRRPPLIEAYASDAEDDSDDEEHQGEESSDQPEEEEQIVERPQVRAKAPKTKTVTIVEVEEDEVDHEHRRRKDQEGTKAKGSEPAARERGAANAQAATHTFEVAADARKEEAVRVGRPTAMA